MNFGAAPDLQAQLAMAENNRVELESDAQAAAVGLALAALSLRLERMLRDAVQGGNTSNPGVLRKLQARIAAEVASFQAQVIPLAREIVGKAFADSANATAEQLGARGQLRTNVAQTSQAKTILEDEAASRLANASVSAGRRAENGLRQAALRELADKQNQLKSQAQTADEVLSDLERRGMLTRGADGARLVSIEGKDGKVRNYQAQKYGELVVKTVSRTANTTAVKQQLLTNGFDLVEIDSHANACEDCQGYEGEVYSITGATPGYPILTEEPPFHPNCTHVALPGPDPEIEQIRRQA